MFFIYSFVQSFIHSLIPLLFDFLFTHSLIHKYSVIYSFTPSRMHYFIHSFTYLFILSFSYSFVVFFYAATVVLKIERPVMLSLSLSKVEQIKEFLLDLTHGKDTVEIPQEKPNWSTHNKTDNTQSGRTMVNLHCFSFNCSPVNSYAV